MENQNLIKVDPKEFGLEENQVQTIEQAFLPKIQEREGLVEVYGQIIKAELTPELCKQAKETRLKLVKVRTGIAEIHKTQKAFFLAAGRFVDAWKNKETAPVEQMEQNLEQIENHFINLEKERIAKQTEERIEKLRVYSENPELFNVGQMTDEAFEMLLNGQKLAYEQRIEAQRIEAEKEAEIKRKYDLNQFRRNKTIRLIEFIDGWETVDFGEMEDDEFMTIVNSAIEKRTQKEAEQEKIRLKNERLQKEAKKKQKELEAERIEKQKLQDEIDRKNREAESERQRIEKENAAKLEAEKKEEQASDKEKLTKWVNSFSIGDCDLKDAQMKSTKDVISARFEAFKEWALTQI